MYFSAQNELNSSYLKEDISKNYIENWPLYFTPYLTRPFIPPLLPTHPTFNINPPYHQFSTGSSPLTLPSSCRYPSYFSTISTNLRSPPEFLSYSQSLTYPEVRKIIISLRNFRSFDEMYTNIPIMLKNEFLKVYVILQVYSIKIYMYKYREV